MRFAKYRQIFSYEFNPQFLKPKNCVSDKNCTEEEKNGKQIQFNSYHEEKNVSKKRNANEKQTVVDLHHVACFVLQTTLPTATGDISNFCYKCKHFTYNSTVCDRQMGALGDVHCYGVKEKKRFY